MKAALTFLLFTISLSCYSQKVKAIFKDGSSQSFEIITSSTNYFVISGMRIYFRDLISVDYAKERKSDIEDQKKLAKYGVKISINGVDKEILVDGDIIYEEPSKPKEVPKELSQIVQLVNNEGHAQVQTVIEVDNKDAETLYKLVMRWLTIAYKNPDQVIKAKLDNEMIRGEGVDPNGFKPGILVEPVKYTFQIDIKDNKVRYTMHEFIIMNSAYGSYPIEGEIYKNDGSVRTKDSAQQAVLHLTQYANELIISLKDALTKTNKDDW